MPSLPRGRGALAQPFAGRILRLEDRAEQRQARDPVRMTRRDMLADQRAERMADEMRAVDAEMSWRHRRRPRPTIRS